MMSIVTTMTLLHLRTPPPHPFPPTKLLPKPPSLLPLHRPTTLPSSSSSPFDVLRLLDALLLPPDPSTYSSLLHECALTSDLSSGKLIHAHVRRNARSLRGHDALAVANRLLFMYASCHRPRDARDLFDVMPFKDAISWAAVIVGYFDSGDYLDALEVFVEMLVRRNVRELIGPERVCVSAALRSCTLLGACLLGKSIHGFVLKTSSADRGITQSLIELYSLEGLDDNHAFDVMLKQNLTTSIYTMNLYFKLRLYEEVIKIFDEMKVKGKRHNASVLSVVVKACGRIRDGEQSGRQLHADVIKLGFGSDWNVQRSFIEMYGRCGLLCDARRVFDYGDGERSVEGWNVMVGAYLREGCYSEAVRVLYEMKAAGVELEDSLVNQVRLACLSK